MGKAGGQGEGALPREDESCLSLKAEAAEQGSSWWE